MRRLVLAVLAILFLVGSAALWPAAPVAAGGEASIIGTPMVISVAPKTTVVTEEVLLLGRDVAVYKFRVEHRGSERSDFIFCFQAESNSAGGAGAKTWISANGGPFRETVRVSVGSNPFSYTDRVVVGVRANEPGRLHVYEVGYFLEQPTIDAKGVLRWKTGSHPFPDDVIAMDLRIYRLDGRPVGLSIYIPDAGVIRLPLYKMDPGEYVVKLVINDTGFTHSRPLLFAR